MDFTNISDDALRAELKRREEEAACIERQKRDEQGSRITTNVDALLAVVPEHGRTSCSDEKPTNASRARCTRCVLLEIQREGYMDADEFRVEVIAYWRGNE